MSKEAQIPATADKFKLWADRECGAWSKDLQLIAYAAWDGLKRGEQTAFQLFKLQYEAKQ